MTAPRGRSRPAFAYILNRSSKKCRHANHLDGLLGVEPARKSIFCFLKGNLLRGEAAQPRSPQALGGGSHHPSYRPPEPSQLWRSFPTTHGLLEPPTESQGKGSHHLPRRVLARPAVRPRVRGRAPLCFPTLVILTAYHHHLSGCWRFSPGFEALGLSH